MHEPKSQRIKRTRSETLIALKLFYPSAMTAGDLFVALLAVFPDLTWPDFLKDLAYLDAKGYIRRTLERFEEGQADHTPPKRRWWKLQPEGVEIADGCLTDPALEI